MIEKSIQQGPRQFKSCPFLGKLKSYKKVASDSGREFSLTDMQTLAMMRNPCSICLEPATDTGNGITRLRCSSDNGTSDIGDFTIENTATACTACNIMKGFRTVEDFVDICRHISTHRGLGDFGSFHDVFPNNTSKRGRSAYLTESKTHALSTEQFNDIVAMPCHYCGKLASPPSHYNGLDRLDSMVRVYTTTSCVSCCGTCNVAKQRYTEDQFLAHCAKVAAAAAAK